ncbi:hypothetical protein [Extibacter muris]|uniref:Uncharacterized protein n=1 Tax=Extibacter muris TaxID=1796622 RepID=A0A4V6P6Q6_9FIRM|nr:hypothetical protein [Extibacter muris]MCU0078454.1 hypothetical protein [Extibacter muris]TDA21580.1 hypothetical protein E1963_11360 [Extibacter muris]
MILDFYEGKLDGDTWEDLCQSCYRIKYQEQHYTEIPATQGGDAGIEGFTRTGIVNQCYYPEREYSDDEIYNHQRDKMTADIGKLLKDKYKKRLNQLGVPLIHEWHFVIPFYKDSRILQHAETKRQEVLKCKKDNPSQYDYIADDFIIVIKQAEDFRFEITRSIRNSLTDAKLNLAVREVKAVDWEKCDSEKTNNIKRKVKAVMNDIDEEDEGFKQVIATYIEAYIKGMEILRMLRVSYAEIYEDVYGLEQAYKKQVSLKTCMNTDKSLNIKIFNEILEDFEKQLRETCQYFTVASIFELKTDIISMWLADCSMQFRK